MAKQEKKIRSCRQAWLAYRSAFSMINWLLSQRDCWINEEDKKAIAAYKQIIKYERKKMIDFSTGEPNSYFTAPDWELYRLGYQDSISYMNRIRKGDVGTFAVYLREERWELIRSFATILKYARVNGLSNADKRKLYQFTRRFNLETVYNRLQRSETKSPFRRQATKATPPASKFQEGIEKWIGEDIDE